MKKLIFTTLFSFLTFSITAQTLCNQTGNLVIFSNYDGGPLNINVDVNIPNLKIGVVSYRATVINISGAYASNVTGVAYAGFNSSSNSCGFQTSTTTSISGQPAGATTNISQAPSSPISNPNGNGSVICGYSCNLNASQGGCNTADQIEAYFLNYFPNSVVYSHEIQYGCWSGTQSLQTTGNCCATVIPLATQAQSMDASCYNECDGSAAVTASGGNSPYTYSWSNNATTATVNNLCAGSYTVTVTDASQATETETVIVGEPGLVQSGQNFTECQGFSIQVGTSTYNITGNYVDTLQSPAGCDSVVYTMLNILPVKTFSQDFNPTRCEDFSVTVGNQTYSEAGIYVDSLQTADGCDSVVTTEIDVDSIILIETHPGDSVVDEGNPASFSISLFESYAGVQWQTAAPGDTFVNIRPGVVYTGHTTNFLTLLEALPSMDSTLYRALVNFEECEDTTSTALLTVRELTSVTETGEKGNLLIYPNPVQEQLNISQNGVFTGERYTVFTGNGAVVHEGVIQSEINVINTSKWSAGIYTLRIGNGTGNTMKIVKQ